MAGYLRKHSFLFVLGGLFLIYACNPSEFQGAVTGKERSPRANADSEGDDTLKNDKMSDDSEGVPGYLVNPSKNIKVEKQKTNQYVVKGKPQSVKVDSGEVTKVLVGFFKASKNDFANAEKDENGRYFIEPNFISSTSPDSEGAMNAEVVIDDNKVLIIGIIANTSPKKVWVEKNAADKPQSAFVDDLSKPEVKILEQSYVVPTTPQNNCQAPLDEFGRHYVMDNGELFVLGNPGESCSTACDDYNGVSLSTRDRIGSGGSQNECLAIASKLCTITGGSASAPSVSGSNEVGCSMDKNGLGQWQNFYINGKPTQPNAQVQGLVRVCGCAAD